MPFPASLPNELLRWQDLWKSKEKDRLPSNLLQTLGVCDSDTFPNIHALLIIGCTLPISSAEAGRSFSLLRRLKTYTRSTMGEERMSDLAAIAIHYEVVIPVEDVCQRFVSTNPRRMFAKSLFDEQK